MQKIIAVIGAGFVNKGAYLMLIAVRQMLEPIEGIQLVLPFKKRGLPTHSMKRKSFYCSIETATFPRSAKFLLSWLIPNSFLCKFGILAEESIDAVIDISGYKYADVFPLSGIEKNIAIYERFSKSGKPVIIMPQAFGPFTDDRRRALMMRLVDIASIIYARDSMSYAYIYNIVGDISKLKKRPDFTCLVPPKKHVSCDHHEGEVCIVPNQRVIDKSSEISIEKSYFSVLLTAISAMQKNGKRCFFLIHAGRGDIAIAKELNHLLTVPLEILREEDPQKAKYIISKSFCLISSRYHAIISALTQEVPVIALGWSHKYSELFKEYEIPEWILDIKSDPIQVMAKVSKLFDFEAITQFRGRAKVHNAQVAESIQALRSEVVEILKKQR